MHYYALISSLPMLTLENDTGMTVERFLSACQSFVNKAEFRILEELTLDSPPESFGKTSFAGRYAAWEASLRNAIVRARAGKAGADPAAYLNRDAEVEADAERAVNTAWAAGNPLEREFILDRARWTKIEELESGKPFSFEKICAYKLKLLVQRKWTDRRKGKPEDNLEQSVNSVARASESN